MALGYDTPFQAAQKFQRAAHDFATIDRRILSDTAFMLKKHVAVQVKIAAPKGRLNVGKKGSRVGVRYTMYPKSAKLYMFGPAQLIEFDTKGHRIPRPTRGRGKKKKANTKPIYIPGIGVRAYANHPGTKGKHPWEKGLATGLPKVGPTGHKVVHDTMVKTFRG